MTVQCREAFRGPHPQIKHPGSSATTPHAVEQAKQMELGVQDHDVFEPYI